MKVDGGIFIDRNSDHFSCILDWLRDGPSARLPSSRLHCDQLHTEASFYQIESLSSALKARLRRLDNAGCDTNPGDLGLHRLRQRLPQAHAAMQEILRIAFADSATLPDERKLPPAAVEVQMRFGNELGPGDSRIEPTHGKIRLTITGCFCQAEYNLALPFRPGNDLIQLAARIESLQLSGDAAICTSMLNFIPNLGQTLLHLQQAGGYPAARCQDFHVCCNDRYGLAREYCTCSFKLKLAG